MVKQASWRVYWLNALTPVFEITNHRIPYRILKLQHIIIFYTWKLVHSELQCVLTFFLLSLFILLRLNFIVNLSVFSFLTFNSLSLFIIGCYLFGSILKWQCFWFKYTLSLFASRTWLESFILYHCLAWLLLFILRSSRSRRGSSICSLLPVKLKMFTKLLNTLIGPLVAPVKYLIKLSILFIWTIISQQMVSNLVNSWHIVFTMNRWVSLTI